MKGDVSVREKNQLKKILPFNPTALKLNPNLFVKLRCQIICEWNLQTMNTSRFLEKNFASTLPWEEHFIIMLMRVSLYPLENLCKLLKC